MSVFSGSYSCYGNRYCYKNDNHFQQWLGNFWIPWMIVYVASNSTDQKWHHYIMTLQIIYCGKSAGNWVVLIDGVDKFRLIRGKKHKLPTFSERREESWTWEASLFWLFSFLLYQPAFVNSIYYYLGFQSSFDCSYLVSGHWIIEVLQI